MTVVGRLALVVGHEKRAQGATGAHPLGMSEYAYNTRLAAIIETIGVQRGHTVKTFFRDKVGIEGAYANVARWEPDAAVELHFNAFNGQVRGTETLFSDANDDKAVMEREFAQLVQSELCRALDRPASLDRGIKDRPLNRGERGYHNVNQLSWIPSILIEPFFGDNREDATLAVDRADRIATAIVIAFEQWKIATAAARGYLSAAEQDTMVAASRSGVAVAVATAAASVTFRSPMPSTSRTPPTPRTPRAPKTTPTPRTPRTPRTLSRARKPRG
jgi:hypothetical protein